MEIGMNDGSTRCYRCGRMYDKRKGNFPRSYGALYKGEGYMHVCRECVVSIYNAYLMQCEDTAMATKQVCRKLDIYWDESVFNTVEKRSTPQNVVLKYIAKIASTASYANKSYDDTLIAENKLWEIVSDVDIDTQNDSTPVTATRGDEQEECEYSDDDITDEIREFWGSGYTPDMYMELENRRRYWVERLPGGDDLDVGSEAFIRQICALELDINKARVNGKPVDKLTGALNTLLGSMNMKPAQRKNDDIENDINTTPMGVWLYRYEQKRPLPEIDESLKDTNGIKKYVFTWMGHLCKMMGIKNGYTKMYEEEIERLRVFKPEYDGDEEGLLIESYSDSHGDE